MVIRSPEPLGSSYHRSLNLTFNLLAPNEQEDRERYFVGLSLAAALLVISTILAMLHQRCKKMEREKLEKTLQMMSLKNHPLFSFRFRS